MFVVIVAVMLDGVPVRRFRRLVERWSQPALQIGFASRWRRIAQNCHTRWECAVVPPVFTRHHNYGSSGGVRWFSGRGDS